MARVTTQVAASNEDVWQVLADGWSYATWVVGTVKIRAVDTGFPAPGTKLHHAVGAWPLLLEDETEILECEPGRRLLMQARGWPFGEATVELVLHPEGERTTVEMYEEPTSGPGAWVNNKLIDAVGAKRLTEALDRLRRLVEGQSGRPVTAAQDR
jgi:uncharacterized protein YndB with AHSA1/START domain